MYILFAIGYWILSKASTECRVEKRVGRPGISQYYNIVGLLRKQNDKIEKKMDNVCVINEE